LEKYPNFSRLLDDLSSQHLAKDGTDKVLKEEYEKTKLQLESEKLRYMENTTIYEELKEIVNDFHLRSSADISFSLRSDAKVGD
jgi:hypothetical protein